MMGKDMKDKGKAVQMLCNEKVLGVFQVQKIPSWSTVENRQVKDDVKRRNRGWLHHVGLCRMLYGLWLLF